jgi:hypothetical protein
MARSTRSKRGSELIDEKGGSSLIKARLRSRCCTPFKILAPQTMRFVMGDMALNNQLASVIEEPHGSLRELDGVLGPTALHMTRIEFDWEHQCLRWDSE